MLLPHPHSLVMCDIRYSTWLLVAYLPAHKTYIFFFLRCRTGLQLEKSSTCLPWLTKPSHTSTIFVFHQQPHSGQNIYTTTTAETTQPCTTTNNNNCHNNHNTLTDYCTQGHRHTKAKVKYDVITCGCNPLYKDDLVVLKGSLLLLLLHMLL